MTREKFRELLYENGYKKYVATDDDKEFPEGWWAKHDGWMWQEFPEVEADVAFNIPEKGNVWLSIISQDTRLEWDVNDLTVVNMLLSAFGVKSIFSFAYNERVH